MDKINKLYVTQNGQELSYIVGIPFEYSSYPVSRIELCTNVNENDHWYVVWVKSGAEEILAAAFHNAVVHSVHYIVPETAKPTPAPEIPYNPHSCIDCRYDIKPRNSYICTDCLSSPRKSNWVDKTLHECSNCHFMHAKAGQWPCNDHCLDDPYRPHWHARPAPGKHMLYCTDDKDKPESICDSNGEVVLALCRVCHRGEAELEGPCPGFATKIEE